MRPNLLRNALATVNLLALAICSTRAAEVIEVTGVITELEIVEGAELQVIVEAVDGDIKVLREERTTVSFTVEEFDPRESDRGSAKIERDEEAGSIRLRLRGDLKDSDIVVYAPLTAALRLKALDGDIEVTGGLGEVDASATDGDILLRDIGGTIVASSNDGDIMATLANGRSDAPISLISQDGDIELMITQDMNADVTISTIDGDFESDVPMKLLRNSESGSPVFKRRGDGVFLKGTIGTGGHQLSLKTIDGDIELRWKQEE